MIGASQKFTDLKDFSITVDGSDITTGVTECHIWQDINTPSWSCSIACNDTSNMIQAIPIKQGSKVTVMLKSDTVDSLACQKQFQFIIYKIDGRDVIKSKNQGYTLHAITETFLKNQSTRVQKYYSNTPDKIVSSIISDRLGGSVITTSASEKISVIVPNLTPFVAANWLGKFAVYSNQADYLFFMSDLNQYKFKSFEDMYSSDSSGLTLKQGVANIRNEAAALDKNDAFNMLHYQIDHYDALSNLAGGFYGSTTVTYDIYNQKWETKPFKFGDDNSQDKTNSATAGASFLSDADKAFQAFVPVHDKMVDCDHPNKKAQVDKYAGSRRSAMLKLEQDRLFVQLAGQTKYWEILGKSIEVDMQTHEDFSGEKLDKYYSGKYLVAAIEHVIAGKEYYVNLELIKKRLKRPM